MLFDRSVPISLEVLAYTCDNAYFTGSWWKPKIVLYSFLKFRLRRNQNRISQWDDLSVQEGQMIDNISFIWWNLAPKFPKIILVAKVFLSGYCTSVLKWYYPQNHGFEYVHGGSCSLILLWIPFCFTKFQSHLPFISHSLGGPEGL